MAEYSSPSLQVHNVTEVELNLAATETQNVIAMLYSVRRADQHALTINDEQITITSDVALKDRVKANHQIVAHHYPLICHRIPAMAQTKFEFHSTVFDSNLDESRAQVFMIAGSINMRAVTSLLRGNSRMSREFSEGICPEMRSNLLRCDYTSLFTVGHIMVANLYTMSRNQWVPIRSVMPTENIVLVNTSSNQAATITTAQNAIHAGRICLNARTLTASDWQAVRALATGLPAFTCVVDHNQRPIASTFASPGFQFMIYDDQPVTLPAARPIIASQLLHSLKRIAETLLAETCYVKGFLAASTYICGQLAQHDILPPGHASGPEIETFYVTSGFEICTIRLPQVKGSNFLWDILGLNNERIGKEDWAVLQPEYTVLNRTTLDEYMCIMGGTAALYSLGVSTMFHKWNISGRCLNVYIQPLHDGEQVSVYPILQYLFTPRNYQSFSPISKVAAQIVGQFSSMSMLSRSFQASSWCAGGRHIDMTHENMYWNSIWGRNIPYIVNPLAVTRFLVTLPDTFGYAMPPVIANMGDGFNSAGSVDTIYFSAFFADERYKQAIASKAPFQYVAFGALALNYLHQHTRRALPTTISFLGLVHSKGPEPRWLEGTDMQPIYQAALHSFVVGTIPTYDWFYQCVLVPHIRQANMSVQDWNILKFSHTGPSATAGFVLDVSDMSQYQWKHITNLDGLFKLGGQPDIRYNGIAAGTSQGMDNAEN